MTHKIIDYGGFSIYPKYISLTEEEEKALSEVTEEMLYEHMKRNCVGITTPTGKTKFIKRFDIGRVSVSLQISYYVWSYREDNNLSQDDPITEHEFNECSQGWIDVCIDFEKQRIMSAGQHTLESMATYLVKLGTEPAISW